MAAASKRSAFDKHWQVQNPAPPNIIEQLGVDPVIGSILYHRGITTPETVHHFLSDTYPHGLHDPFLMRGMEEASKRVARAIAEHEQIAVYGDYDTDGITATTLLSTAITAMGGHIVPYIPHREREGYGLNSEAIEHLAAEGIQLLITVDCGISNVDEVALAQARGMDVIVTDHHTPPAVLPDALAIVNPKQPGCTYPYDQLVGVGIAFKLIVSLYKQGIRTMPRAREMLDLVALGTVADIGPLTGENRILVKAGLDAIRQTERPGLVALMKAAGTAQNLVDTQAIGFRLAPRLNAAGRLDDARLAYHLLLAETLEQANELAQELSSKNQQRQRMTEEFQALAQQQAEADNKHHQNLIVIAGEAYNPGVVGLVASRLVGIWNRPVVLLAQGEEESTGSARSIEGFSIIEALTACKDLFERFGGHSMAAGMTIKNTRLAELEERLVAIANEQITDDMLIPKLTIDAEVPSESLTWAFYDLLVQLEPFGSANPQPILMTRDMQAVDVRPVGTNEQHLKLQLTQNGSQPLEAIAFWLGHLAEPLRKHPRIDVAYTLDVHEWNQQRALQLNVKDFRRV
jgi:single-stranded-DNA-specific exonuclease